MSDQKPTKEQEAKVQEILAGHRKKYSKEAWEKEKNKVEAHVRRHYLRSDNYLDDTIKKQEEKHSFEKSWENVKKLRHQIQKDHKKVTEHMEGFMEAFNILVKRCDEAYHSAPSTDAPTITGSPISPGKLWALAKAHIHKKGFTSIGYVVDSWNKPDFSDAVNEAMRWLMRHEDKSEGLEGMELYRYLKKTVLYGNTKERKKKLEELEELKAELTAKGLFNE